MQAEEDAAWRLYIGLLLIAFFIAKIIDISFSARVRTLFIIIFSDYVKKILNRYACKANFYYLCAAFKRLINLIY